MSNESIPELAEHLAAVKAANEKRADDQSHEKDAPKSAMSYGSIGDAMAQMSIQSSIAAAVSAIHSARGNLPRKHRLNPNDPEHQPIHAAPETIKLLMLAEEALICAAKINQMANPRPGDPESLRNTLEPLLQAAEQSLEREKQRQFDSELRCQSLLSGEEPQ